MRLLLRAPALAAPLLLAALAGCDRDTADLVREIDAAREGCTEAGLRAGDQECVRMMERYAEMGTEAIHTYIGALRTLNRALDRMPPPAFDTAGLGHAISPSLVPATGPAPAAGPTGSDPFAADPFAADRYDADRYDATASRAYGAAPYPPPASRREDRAPRARFDDPRAGWSGPRDHDPRYDDARYGDPRYDRPRYADPRYDDPRFDDGRFDGRYGDPRDMDPRYDDLRYTDPRYDAGGADGAPVRGRLLPPEQRLRRPWIDGYGDDPRYDRYPRMPGGAGWDARDPWADPYAGGRDPYWTPVPRRR